MIGRSTLAGLALLLAPLAGALELRLDPAGLDPVQEGQARHLLASAVPLLPAAWQHDDRVLELRFDRQLADNQAGHHRRGQISLNPALLTVSAPAGPGPDRALATVVHEIAHAFDRQGGRWSSDPVFRRLAGWDRLGKDNAYRLRSPDDYERHSAAESFAVNLEWFLLDPTYACRRPALAAWYAQQFGPAAQPAADCAPGLPWLAATGRNGGVALEVIDPARVYAVDYLLADSGGPPMSRFGHSMLRLVICAPGREPGERCRMDLSHHRVLSFRAFVDDVQVSSWAGLTGGYPSRLFLLPLDQVIDEYNRVELRDLRAWPLALSPARIDRLLQAAARVHWEYDGDYTFIGNNCAVETGRLLDTALDPAGGRHYRDTFPRGVLRQLVADGLADGMPSGQLDPASGLWFPSARAEYQTLFAQLRAAGQVPAMGLMAWLDASPAARGALPAQPTLEQAAAWLVLERAALRRAEQRAMASLKPRLRQSPALQGALDGWLAWLGRIDAPGRLPIGGYGLPQTAELAAADAALQPLLGDGPQQWQALQQQAELEPAMQAQLSQGRQRLQRIGAQLRARLQ